jgi:hypothetical protein
MATKKKSKKKSTKSKKAAAAKVAAKKKLAPKGRSSKKSAKRKAAPNKSAAKKKTLKKATGGKTANTTNKETRTRSRGRAASAFSGEMSGPDSAGQSGDLQGLSNVEGADSESVDELIEEGNAFEAGVVEGVEEADDGGVREVRTREVPEDDVPGEYLDED